MPFVWLPCGRIYGKQKTSMIYGLEFHTSHILLGTKNEEITVCGAISSQKHREWMHFMYLCVVQTGVVM